MLKNIFYPTVFMIVALLVPVLLQVRPVSAAPTTVTFTVNSTLDQPDDLTIPGSCHTVVNTCTLRAAVMQANRTTGLGATILIPAGTYTLTIPFAGVDGEENGDLNLTTPASGSSVISIIGTGAATTIIDANQIDRVFSIAANRTANISGVTIRNGYTLNHGSGIYNTGILTVSNTAIYGNHAGLSGGGILNNATLTVINSTISQNNSALGYGGGVYNGATLTVIKSTLSQNNANNSGGGMFLDGPTTIRDSTIYGNGADDNGGGIWTDDVLYIVNSTLSQNYANNNGGGIYKHRTTGLTALYNTSVIGNDADHDHEQNGGIGGGVYSEAGSRFIVVNTLIAGNTIMDTPFSDDCNGTLEAYGLNLFGDMSGCTIPNALNAGLILLNTIGPLQNNGGPTWTHALLAGSAAIDTTFDNLGCVNETGALLTTDQRGAPRPVGARCDVGAFEYSPLHYIYLPLVLR